MCLQCVGTHQVQYETSVYLAYASTADGMDVFVQGLHHGVVVSLEDDVAMQGAMSQGSRHKHLFRVFVVRPQTFQCRYGGEEFQA